MSAKHNALLGLVLIVLIGYYVFFEASSPSPEPKIMRGASIYLIEPWDVKQVEVATADGKEVDFERGGHGWRLNKGNQVDGLQDRLDDFVTSLLMTVEIDKIPLEGKVLSDCGLVNPSYTITVTDITDKTYTLFVGDKTPVGTCLYGRFDDTTQVLVGGALLSYELSKLNSIME